LKTVILFGSPRKDGNTMELVRPFSDGLKQRGHSVRTLYLNDMNIRPCQGCEACLPRGICRIKDDMKDIRKCVRESDLVVFASPIYWFNVSAQLKVAIDRSFAFLDRQYNSRIEGKKAVTLMTCASDEPDVCSPALAMFTKTFELLKLDYAGHIEATGCEGKGNVGTQFTELAARLAETVL
jgi:multimeric flavodoxin WrbA